MYKLVLQDYNGEYCKNWLFKSNEDLNRPFIHIGIDISKHRYYLENDIHEWLESFDICYLLDYTKYGPIDNYHFKYYISFENKINAMLFKLTWM